MTPWSKGRSPLTEKFARFGHAGFSLAAFFAGAWLSRHDLSPMRLGKYVVLGADARLLVFTAPAQRHILHACCGTCGVRANEWPGSLFIWLDAFFSSAPALTLTIEDGGSIPRDMVCASSALSMCASFAGAMVVREAIMRSLERDVWDICQVDLMSRGLAVFNAHKNAGKGKRGTAANAKNIALNATIHDSKSDSDDTRKQLYMARQSTWNTSFMHVFVYVCVSACTSGLEVYLFNDVRVTSLLVTALCITGYATLSLIWYRTPSIGTIKEAQRGVKAPFVAALVCCLAILGAVGGQPQASLASAGFHAVALLVTEVGAPPHYADFIYTVLTAPLRTAFTAPVINLHHRP